MSADDSRDEEERAPSLEAPSLKPPSLFKRRPKKAAPTPTPVQEPTPAPPAPVAAPLPAPAPPPVAPAPEPVVVRDEPMVDEPKAPREPRAPWLTGRPAAAVTGLVVGGLIVAGTAGAQSACSAVRGTSSCGGAGFFLLLAILVVAVLVGGAMLRAAHVPEAGSTAFLAVGLVSVVTLLFLVGQLFQWWMAIVIPLVAVVMFLVSHWVTTTFTETT